MERLAGFNLHRLKGLGPFQEQIHLVAGAITPEEGVGSQPRVEPQLEVFSDHKRFKDAATQVMGAELLSGVQIQQGT
jgi:hypothetical protein